MQFQVTMTVVVEAKDYNDACAKAQNPFTFARFWVDESRLKQPASIANIRSLLTPDAGELGSIIRHDDVPYGC